MIRSLLAFLLTFAPQYTVPSHTGAPAASGSGIVVTGKTCANVVGGPVASVTCTWSSNPSAGETIHCAVSNYSNSYGGGGVSDNASPSNTYSQNGSTYAGTGISDGQYALFDSFGITNSPSTTTLNIGFNSTFPGIGCFSTTGGTGAVDGALGTYSQASGTTLTAAVVPTGSADISECGVFTSGGSTITAGAGYTLVATLGANESSEYKILSTSGSQNATATVSPSSAGDMICGTYK